MPKPITPLIAADAIIELVDRPGRPIVLIERLNPPHGWAIPGGFVDLGEPLDVAAAREAEEETGLPVTLLEQFHVYSDPSRDPRRHTISTVYLATAHGEPRGGDDAAEARAFAWDALPSPIVFDHREILADVRRYLLTGARRRL